MKNQVVTPNPTVVYSSMWTKLKAHVGDYAPQTLVTDMEVASGSSMRDAFGEAVHVQYCYFHLRKCLREHIGEVHALAELSEPAFYNLYRMVISLPFIPAGNLVQVRVSQGRPWSRRRAVSLLPQVLCGHLRGEDEEERRPLCTQSEAGQLVAV